MKIGIIVSRFNHFITDKLLEGALDYLKKENIDSQFIEVVKIPGCAEMPLMLKTMAKHKYDALICLGAIIRGETSHYQYVCDMSARGIYEVSKEFEIPVGFGVLMCDTLEQAINRAGGKHGNKGVEAASAALEMVSILRGMR